MIFNVLNTLFLAVENKLGLFKSCKFKSNSLIITEFLKNVTRWKNYSIEKRQNLTSVYVSDGLFV